MNLSKLRSFVLLLSTLLPVACASTNKPPNLQLPKEPSDKLITPSARTSPAVVDLLNQAHTATQQGDLQKAEILLERTVRIEPRNPSLWNYLAKLRLMEGKLQQAINLAARSNALVGRGNNKLKADNWRIIAHARYQKGNFTGARQAQQKADALWK